MTVPVALAVVGICLAALALLTAPQASRLLRPGTPPPRPRRFWVTLLVAREIGTGGAAAAAAWAALASGSMPAWAAAAAAGAAAYLVAETVAPALGLAMPAGFADWLGDGIDALPVDLPGPALLATLYEHRFSRLPVYRGDRDNVIGVLYAKDLCGLDVTAPGFRLEPLLRPPTFVPVSMRAGDVFRELRRKV